MTVSTSNSSLARLGRGLRPSAGAEAIGRCKDVREQAAGGPVAMATRRSGRFAYLRTMTSNFARARQFVQESNTTLALAELGGIPEAMSRRRGVVELLRHPASDKAERGSLPARGARIEKRENATSTPAPRRCWPRRCPRPAQAGRGRRAVCRERACAAPEDVVTQAMWRGVRAELLAAEGELAAADALAEEAWTLIAASDLLNDHADVLLARAEVLRLGRARRGGGRYQGGAVELYERKGNLVSAARARSWPAVPAPA